MTGSHDNAIAEVGDDALIALFPGELITRDNAAHYRGRLGRQLLLNKCTACRQWHAPPHPVCPHCWSTEVVATPVAGTGTIYLLTLLHQGPPAPGVRYDPPYPVASVELDEQSGLRFTATVVDSDPDAVHIGARVELRWRIVDQAPMPVFAVSQEP